MVFQLKPKIFVRAVSITYVYWLNMRQRTKANSNMLYLFLYTLENPWKKLFYFMFKAFNDWKRSACNGIVAWALTHILWCTYWILNSCANFRWKNYSLNVICECLYSATAIIRCVRPNKRMFCRLVKWRKSSGLWISTMFIANSIDNITLLCFRCMIHIDRCAMCIYIQYKYFTIYLVEKWQRKGNSKKYENKKKDSYEYFTNTKLCVWCLHTATDSVLSMHLSQNANF